MSTANTYGCVAEEGKTPSCQPCLGEMTQAECAASCAPGVEQRWGCDPSRGQCRKGSGGADFCGTCRPNPACAAPQVGFACLDGIGCSLAYGSDVRFPTLDACIASGACGPQVPTTFTCTPEAGCVPAVDGEFPNLAACKAKCASQPPIGHLLGYRCGDNGCEAVYAGTNDGPGVVPYRTLGECQAACQSWQCGPEGACSLQPGSSGEATQADCQASCPSAWTKSDTAIVVASVAAGLTVLALVAWLVSAFSERRTTRTTTSTTLYAQRPY